MISGLIVLAVCGGALLFAKSKKPDFKKTLPEKSQTEQKELIVHKSKEERKVSRDFNISTAALTTILMSKIFPVFLPVSIPLLLYTSFPVFKGTIQAWHEKKKLGNDAVVSSSILLCFATQQYTAIALGAWFYFLGSKIITERLDRR